MRLTEESARSVREQSAGRTAVSFVFSGEGSAWAIVDAWAARRECELVHAGARTRRYERSEGYRALSGQPGSRWWGSGGAATVIVVEVDGLNVRIEGWVRLPWFQQSRRRPPELHLEIAPSSGVIFTFVADYGRQTLNALLSAFGQPALSPVVYVPDYS